MQKTTLAHILETNRQLRTATYQDRKSELTDRLAW